MERLRRLALARWKLLAAYRTNDPASIAAIEAILGTK